MQAINFRSLKIFLELSQTLHFGKTSQRVHMSPSTLSRIVQQLEEDVGVPLFYRDNRSVELTPEGVLFQQYAREVLHNWQQFRASLFVEQQALMGTISIFCSVTASYSFLHDVLARFRADHPKIEIVLHTGDYDEAVDRVMDDKEDVGIVADERMPAAMDFKLLGMTSLVLIAPLESEYLDTPNRMDVHHWESMPLILPEKGVFRERIDHWFSQTQLTPNIYAQVGGNEAIVSMVSLGFGIGLVPQIVVENSPLRERVKVMESQPDVPAVEVGFCTKRKRLQQSPLISALWGSITGHSAVFSADTPPSA